MRDKVFFALQLFADPADPAPADPKLADPIVGAKGKSGDPKGVNSKEPELERNLKYTDEDVDKLISQKVAEWKKKEQKAVDEAKKLAEMNAQQKAEYERDQFKKQLEQYQERESLTEMTKTARKMLSDEEINVPDELLDRLVSTDAEQTKVTVDSFAKLFQESVQNAVKDALKSNAPKAGTGGKATVTKEQILAIKDRAERQRMITEHINLFQ
ncbi:MAG TPA: DUF4355 domain-containing protein [Candidatus Merdenecus merdavium]|nr:DUF4355 domain-containing protein [Candidatus Merdenecus merdavium]